MSELPQIPGYRMDRKLGQGGMADVYLGVQENLERKVAIKILIPSLFRDKQFSLRFIKEAQTAAQLIHPNIITIHDIGRVGDTYFIVMEYLEESLHDRMKKRGSLTPKEALGIIKVIASAMDYAHQKGFIHRDIKPDNIMFRSDGSAVLVDFGIARAIDSTTHLTRTGMSIGTPHYMSPEQCRGEKIDGRSDIYSLGVQLYELLTGKVPYKAENTAGIILKHIQEPIPQLPIELGLFQPLIDKMMAKDKKKRVQTGSEAIKFIEAIDTARDFMPTAPLTVPEVDRQTIQVPPSGMDTVSENITGTTSQPTGKKKSLIALLIFAIAVIVMGTVLIITQKEPADPKTSQTEILNRQIENKETLLVDNGGSEEVSTAKKEDITLLGESITAKTEPAGALEKKTPGKSPTETPKSGKIQLKGNEPGQVGLKSVDVGQSQGWKRKGSPRQGKEKGKPAFVYKTKESNGAAGVVSEKELAGDYQNYLSTVMQKIVLVFPRAKFIVTGRITLSLSIDRLGNVTAGLYNETLSVIPGHGKKRLIKAILGKINRSQLLPPKDVKGNTVRLENRLVKYKVNKSVNRIILTKYE